MCLHRDYEIYNRTNNFWVSVVDARCVVCAARQHASGVNPSKDDSQNSVIGFQLVLKNRVGSGKIRFLHPCLGETVFIRSGSTVCHY